MKKPSLIYCRVSTVRQLEEGTSLDTQAEACQEWATANGYEVGRVTKEVFSGAELFDRPILALDRADIRAGKYSAIIIHSIDRLSRNIAHLAIIEEECRRAGCVLVFVIEGLDNTAEGKLLQSVKAYVAEVERLKIRERSMRGKRAKLLMGKPVMTGSALYGYDHDLENNRYTVNETEARVVKRIFDLLLSGVGTFTMARLFNDEGIPSPYSNLRPQSKWSSATLFRLVTNPSYKGVEIRNRTKRISRSLYVRRPPDEHILMPDGIRPPIISEDIWDAAQSRLKINKGDAARNQKRFYLLRGMITCGVCNRRMFGCYSKQGGREYHYYRCAAISVPYARDCKGVMMRIEELDAWVWEQAKIALQDPTKMRKLLRQEIEAQKDSAVERDLAATKSLHTKTENQLRRLVAKFRNLEDPAFERIVDLEISQTRKELAGLEREIKQLESRQKASAQALRAFDEIFTYMQDVGDKLESATPEEQRMILQILHAEVVYKKDGSDLIFKFYPADAFADSLHSSVATQRNCITIPVIRRIA